MTYRQEQLDELEERARGMSTEERDQLAETLVSAGAPGAVFERLHRAGWRPLSYRQGDGIPGGALDEVPLRIRRRRTK